MATRRQALGYGAAMAAVTAPTAEALAQAVAASGQVTQSGLVGKLEGATQSTTIPTSFKEAPALAELVKAGKLPPVAQRLPAEPMVIKPLDGIGKYGGTWRRAFIGPSDGENGNRIMASDKLLFWDYTGSKIVPCVAKAYDLSKDGKTTTLFLRKGMKWGDGSPFTADDFVFWYEDMYLNKDIVPAPIAEMSAGGKQGRLVKIDETTVQFQFDNPYFLFPDMLAGDTLIGGGQAVRQSAGNSYAAYAPAKYLKQFLPKYSSEAEVTRRAKEAGFDTWVRMLHVKKDWELNPELPTLGPWHTTRPINTPTWAMERNPYYYAVDTDGNQLPYIDSVVMTLAENIEVVNLRALAGEFDLQERHIDLQKLPVVLENRDRGKYDVHLDLAYNGADTTLHVNMGHRADPEVGKWLRSADFRRALSMGIDRDQMNETFWLGLATPGSTAPAEVMPESPGPEWRKKWSTLDVAAANKLLDGLGLTKKDSEGFRLRTDNGQRLIIQLLAVQAFMDWPKHAEMIAQHWRKIGIYADVKASERGLAFQRLLSADHHIFVWTNGGTELLYLYPTWALPTDISNGSVRHRGGEMVRLERCAGHQARGPADAEGAGPAAIGGRATGRAAQQDRPGNLEDHGRPAIPHRHLRPVAGADGGAHRQPPAGQHPGPDLHRAALPHPRQQPSGNLVLQDLTRCWQQPSAELGCRQQRSRETDMATRRQLLGYGSAMAAVAAPTGSALAQAVSGQFAQSGLVGTLQGPTQATSVPAAFKEAPQLAELVKAGKLPPVAQRLPAEPMVLKPLDSTGKYGGTWRRAFIGPSDGENGNRINASDKLLFWDFNGNKIVPCVAKAWDMSKDGKTVTLTLRKGMKWGDGSPFTADDFVFWFDDLYSNKDIVPTPIADMTPGGKPGRVVKIDETTVQFQFDNPFFLFIDLLAGDTLIGGGQSVRQATSFTYGALFAGALPEAVPAEILVRGRGHPPRQGSRLRQLGADAARQEGLAAQPRAADHRRLAHGAPDQHADLGDGTQSVLLGGRHRRQPAALHRQHRHDAGGIDRGGEPARHGRRVRRAGTPYRPCQAAGHSREPRARQIRRSP